MVVTLKYGTTKKQVHQILKQLLESVKIKGFDAKKYCGKIKFEEEPIIIQKQLRDEWR